MGECRESSDSCWHLRGEFPAPGKARAPRPGDTPDDRYRGRLSTLAGAVEAVEKAFADLTKVTGDDGRPLVDARGVDPRDCTAWRDVLRTVDEELVVWSRTFRRVYGADVPLARDTADRYDADDMTDDAEEDVEEMEETTAAPID
jgi:hypothetical protein